MSTLIDKVVLFIICGAIFIQNVEFKAVIPVILIVVIISAAISYIDEIRFTIGAFAVFIIISIYFPYFCFFLPLLCYDVILVKYRYVFLLALLPIAVNHDAFFSASGAMIILFGLISYTLRLRTAAFLKLRAEHYRLLDNSKEASIKLEMQNKFLMDKQNYEINLATLNERNRIARDIHDNVGHLLSSSILQIGAILATSKDESLRKSISTVKDTLSNAMDSIRSSIHNLHDESIDLHLEIESLIRAFTFCPVQLVYEVQSALEKDLKYCFIAVTKEALNNIAKHSNASSASVTVREHPALIQLVIQDNGTITKSNNESGIGLQSITDRVTALNGHVNISSDKGFRIFISVPKTNLSGKD